jgi:hypothetical protein
MGKTRVHLLAKELAIETKDLIAQLEKMGMRGRKAQSSLEDDEVARIRAALAAQEKPQVHVGEEKVVVDRVVKTEEEGQSSVEAHETVVERRVKANVIRRRTSRVEMAPTALAAEAAETAPVQAPTPVPEVKAAPVVPEAPAPLVEETPPLAAVENDAPVEPALPADVIFEAEAFAPAVEAKPDPIPEAPRPAAPEVVKAPVEAAPAAQLMQQEMPRGARILGRIDLKQTLRVEPAPTPVRRPPAAPGARQTGAAGPG